MSLQNSAGKISFDEATSIHIITSTLNTRMRVIYEAQFNTHGGKPDYFIILRYRVIMVSVSRAYRLSYSREHNKHIDMFNITEATRLLSKKLLGLAHCMDYSGCFITEITNTPSNISVKPILHILCPSRENINLCNIAYYNILESNPNPNLQNIQVIFSLVENAEVFA